MMEDFSSRIKALRKERGMKQSEMAEILGLKERSYHCYEYRERYPDVPGLLAIADFFDVSLDYLMKRPDVRERR